MYKVMIVDDEKSIRDGLKKIIDWDAYGFSVCAVARSGEEAYTFYQTQRPDLILTDIRMPGMSGLELIEKLRTEGDKDLEFIILSGYADFEYARRAIRFGVSNYLLKPVDEDEIHHLLSEIGNRILTIRKVAMLETRTKLNKMTYNQPFDNKQEDLHWMEKESLHGLYMVQIDAYRPMLSPQLHNTEEQSPFNCQVKQQITDVFQRFSFLLLGEQQGFVIRDDKSSMDIVVGESILTVWHHDIQQFVYAIRSWFIANGVEVDILVGDRVPVFSDLRQSLASLELRKNAVFYGNDDGVYGLCTEKRVQKGLFVTSALTDKLQSILLERQVEKLSDFIAGVEQEIRQNYISPSVVRVGFRNLLSRTMSYALKTGSLADEIVTFHDLWVPLIDVLCLAQLMTFLSEIMNKTITALDKSAEQGDESIVEKIMQHVQIHYMDKITMQSLAKKFFMNSAYLGQVFSKKNGVSLNQYINTLRMTEAKKLLQQTDLKVYEVAHRVGFDDSNYFITRFEECIGQSPVSYRQNTK